MEDNKKRKLNLKIKTFSDFKRFTSKTLHKIVEKMRGKNELTINQIAKNKVAANEGRPIEEGREGKISIDDLTTGKNMVALLKYAARKSLIDRADRMDAKRRQKITKKHKDKRDTLIDLLEQGKITEKQYHKAIEKLNYKTTKKIYEKDLSPMVTEKPKNPTIQRAIKTAGKVVKTVGKGLGVAVAAPFVLGYQIAKGIGRGVKAIGRGGKTAFLTAGKVAGNVKEQVQTANAEVNREMYEKANEKQKQEIMDRAYRAAEKENAKRDREAARREKLHMSKEQQQIDHEEAMKKTQENTNEQEKEEEK